MNTADPSIWLPEPTVDDCSYARRGEPTLSWLARSTVPRARECRRFLNENLSALPLDAQSSIRNAPLDRWRSAFFELIVARILQELGASLMVERSNPEGKRPDFAAEFPDGKVIVEAISPVMNAVFGDVMKNQTPLLEFIEDKIPNGWTVGVWKLPRIGPADSKREFKKVVTRMLDIPPPERGASDINIIEEFPTGVLHLHLIPKQSPSGRLLIEPPVAGFVNTQERIRYAVRRKKRQVRSSEGPVLLAIEATSISCSFEDFDAALFGHTTAWYNERRELVRTTIIPDGVFSRRGDVDPVYAGVLAFPEVGFVGGPAPVLYIHPRFSGALPDAVLSLEQRIYDYERDEIRVVPAIIPNIMEKLHFVARDA